MTAKLNDQVVKNLPVPERGNRVHYFANSVLQGQPAPPGFGVRVTAAGAKSFVLNYRFKGREHRRTIGAYPVWSVLRAVREARTLRQRIDRGENPINDRAPAPAAKTVAAVLDDFMERYAQKNLRSSEEYEATFERWVKPCIGRIVIHDLRRSHIVDLLDRIEDSGAPVMADRTLAYLRKALRWCATRDDTFVPPIVAGMARTKPKERARTRLLSDNELCIIWPMLDDRATFGAIVKMLLLSGQRRNEVAHMRRREIAADGIWTIPAERYKTQRANHVPLSKAALAVIDAQPQVVGCDYVFPSRTKTTPFSGFGKAKAALDKATGITSWTLHDCRRVAKTLMVRAGVRPDISERVLGHVIGGVEGTYDRHSYADEKRDALERLAGMIERIVSAMPANVTTLERGQAAATPR